jgi:hypothetical protein
MSKSTKMGAGGNIITNRPYNKFNRYISGTGVGAIPFSMWRTKRMLTPMCYNNYHKCKKTK